jgi:hypothetical protein
MLAHDPPGSPPDETFDALARAFERSIGAADRVELVETDLRIAGHAVRLRATGHVLADAMSRTWAHLRVPAGGAGAPALTLDFFDTAHAASPPAVTATRLGEVSPDGRHLSIRRWQSLTAFDRTGGRMITWVPDGTRVGQQERGRPLFEALGVWLQDRGVLPVHAGLVAHAGRGLLCGGPSGSGKSSVCLRCLEAGFEFLGEDTVGLEGTAAGFRGHSIFGSVQLSPEAIGRFPKLAAAREPIDPGEEKHMVMLTDLYAPTLRPDVTIDAIVLPHVTGSPTPTLRPASAGEALRHLAPSTLMRRHDVQAGLDRLGELTRSVPAFWLELGGEPARVPERLASLAADELAR